MHKMWNILVRLISTCLLWQIAGYLLFEISSWDLVSPSLTVLFVVQNHTEKKKNNRVFFSSQLISAVKIIILENCGKALKIQGIMHDSNRRWGWGSKFVTTKWRTADISKIRNFEYWNNESRVTRFFYFQI